MSPGDASLAHTLHGELHATLDECVHCGFCLPACPTYVETGKEMDSPRGRIWLVRALAGGRIENTPTVERHLDLCLDCRACETACPSGVRYGQIIEGARASMEPRRKRSPVVRALRRVALRRLLPNRRLLATALLPVRLARATGVLALASRLPGRVGSAARLTPPVPGRRFLADAPETVPAEGGRRARVALFVGCVMEQVQPDVHRATVRVLARNGCEVVIPREQTCCGALHVHNGDREFAKSLARKNLDALERIPVDAIVVNAAGCGAQLKEYPHLLANDSIQAERARRFADRTEDVTAFLDRLGLHDGMPMKPLHLRVAYDEPCHLIHAQRVSAAPRRLLESIPGLEIVELAESDSCCGSAGVYNLTQPEMSRRLLDRKMDHVERSGAEVLVTANPGCQFQLQSGARERGRELEVLHVVELLDRASDTRNRSKG